MASRRTEAGAEQQGSDHPGEGFTLMDQTIGLRPHSVRSARHLSCNMQGNNRPCVSLAPPSSMLMVDWSAKRRPFKLSSPWMPGEKWIELYVNVMVVQFEKSLLSKRRNSSIRGNSLHQEHPFGSI